MKTETYVNDGFDHVKSKHKRVTGSKRLHKKSDDQMLCKQELPDSGALSGSSFE